MRTILLVGEHHNDPLSKHFVASNLKFLKHAGFDTLILEGMVPHLIPTLQKSPQVDPSGTLLDSYKTLHASCASKDIAMYGAEQPDMRYLINEKGWSPAHPIVIAIREQAFIEQIQRITDGNVIFLTGAGHLNSLAASLRNLGWSVLAASVLPERTSKEVGENFTSQLFPLEKLICFPGADISKPVSALLVDLISSSSASILEKMKIDGPTKIYPDYREHLLNLYKKLSLFSSINYPDLQKAFYALEYNIGSLYAREKRFEQAIKFTKHSLERRITMSEPVDIIEVAATKVKKLIEEQHTAACTAWDGEEPLLKQDIELAKTLTPQTAPPSRASAFETPRNIHSTASAAALPFFEPKSSAESSKPQEDKSLEESVTLGC